MATAQLSFTPPQTAGHVQTTTVTIVDSRPRFRELVGAALTAHGFNLEWPLSLQAWRRGERRLALIDLCDDDTPAVLDEALDATPPIVVVGLIDGDSVEAHFDGLRAGATSVVSRKAHPGAIVDAVCAAMTGRALLPAAVARELAAAVPPARPRPDLSTEQVRMLRLMARGLSMAAIARELRVSERTLYREAKRVSALLGASNRGEALVKAARWGWLAPGSF